METLLEYRHVIDKKIKNDFFNSFQKAINYVDKKKFSFIGIVGSTKEEISHDIDVIIFPGKNTKLGEAIIEYMRLYNQIEKEVKKINKRYYLVTCQKFAMQETTHHIASSQEGSAGMIPIHSMFFANYRDFIKFSPKKFVKNIKETLITIYGNFESIKEINTLSQKELEPYFFVLDFEMNSRIKTFPKHLIRASAESLFDYLRKKYNVGKTEKIPHNVLEIEKEFKKLMKELDKKTYKN